ncbi:uncharacterized protein CC84DRAFT_1178823 [Paraphaeosphaeria sporulosa]|uniref:BTB domain-containing protein n=1 Tax=Paraphaeosphaeria sporulosa TaxID=1460663 RepID=A0A177C7G2_9PLEO|nr:uncharacterized protein CC84DRAFT_1178823 [Paraphaeosphaeria sporulosa]OAG03346.1 hypothetical protein CC84DRAFT_1178823 [Paraphaeosphaeria sporulosa]
MAPTQQQSDKAPPKDFNKHLFNTGMFSDITLKYGHGHTFKAHSVILKTKSAWFAEKCRGPKEIREDGSPQKALNLLECDMASPCKEYHQDEKGDCSVWKLHLQMLKFCYTGDYTGDYRSSPPGRRLDQKATIRASRRHTYLYLLGRRYGIMDLLPLAIEGYANTVTELLQHGLDAALPRVNNAYELFGADKDDALVREARKFAERIADSMDVEFSSELLLEAKKTQINAKMPEAGPDLLLRGYKPKVPSFSHLAAEGSINSRLPTDDKTMCFRCRRAAPVKDTRLCTECTYTPILRQNPGHSSQRTDEFWGRAACTNTQLQTGITCTFWACQFCDKIWQGQGLRLSENELKGCPACVPKSTSVKFDARGHGVVQYGNRLQPYRMEPPTPRRVEWQCRGCLTSWEAWVVQQQKLEDMEKCVCCPEKEA